MKKRIITVFLTLLLICSLTVMSNDNLYSFTDVPENEWFVESVEYVKEKGLMNGITVTTFEPQTSITRGMIVTIIYRLEGYPKVNSELQFSDVNPTYYCCTPIIWASENGIVNGYGKDTFAPDDEITREQFATILYRYAEKKGIDVTYDAEKVNLTNYEDEKKISDYAVNAISWANETGLIKGVTVTTLEPQGKATRAQAATIFMRFDALIEQAKADVPTESKGEKTDAEQPEPDKNIDSSSNKGSGSKKDPADKDDEKDEGKDDSGNGEDNNDDDKNAGEWDDVKDEKPGSNNAPGNDSSNNELTKDDPVEEEKDNEDAVYETPTIAVESVSAKAGEEVSVKVELHNNPGILGMTLKLGFNEEVMTLTEVKKGTALSETTFTAPKGEALKNGCRFLWDAEYVLPEDATNGNILKLTFEISEAAESGAYDVTLSYNDGAIIDNDMLPIDLEIFNGKISIN